MEAKSFPEPSLEKQLKGHRSDITALSFNPNEQQIASGSLDNSVLLWDLRGTIRSYRFQGHDEAVMDVSFSPSGKYMASASRDKSVRIWVPTVTGSTGFFKAHSQTVRSVEFNSDGTKIVTASDDKIVKLWSSDKLKFLTSFVGHTNWVRRASMSQDGSIIASCSDDKTTRLWNPDSGECIHSYKDQKGHGLYVAWHPSGCYVAVGTSHGNVKLYDIRTHNLVQYYSIHNDAINQIAFHPSGSYILTGSKDGKMKILDLLEGHPIFTLSGHNGAINAVNFSPSGDAFASAGEEKLVFLWKTNFTQLGNELKENIDQNPLSTPKSQASKTTTVSKGRNQGPYQQPVATKYTVAVQKLEFMERCDLNRCTLKAPRIWYQCYHGTKYPVTTFVHIDDELRLNKESGLPSFREIPNANSTMIESNSVDQIKGTSKYGSTPPQSFQDQSNRSRAHTSWTVESEDLNYSKYHVGNMSHIPRIPPAPATYSIPSIINRSTKNENFQKDLFGVIKLKEDDVCYTSGTIEWVGRKRSFPINSGFKITNSEPLLKKIKQLNNPLPSHNEGVKDCDCADVLPTVNAIVEHLNALHEAVDLLNLRLNTLEDVVSTNEK